MRRRYKALLLAVLLLIVLAISIRYLSHYSLAVLQPKGEIAQRQRNLIVFATVLSLLVVVPVIGLALFIAHRYKEGNKHAAYTPDWGSNRKLEALWWGIPCLIIFVLAVVTIRTSHSLDPFKVVDVDKKPITIQVVAMRWKWLFLYPDQNIATVNYVQIPINTPVNFKITSDSTMNSFWVPSLGGQIYAMAGMETRLHLIANKYGTFEGSSANLSGEGFAGMRFKVGVRTPEEYASWVSQLQTSAQPLDDATFARLSQPSSDTPVTYFGMFDDQLFHSVMNIALTGRTPAAKESE